MLRGFNGFSIPPFLDRPLETVDRPDRVPGKLSGPLGCGPSSQKHEPAITERQQVVGHPLKAIFLIGDKLGDPRDVEAADADGGDASLDQAGHALLGQVGAGVDDDDTRNAGVDHVVVGLGIAILEPQHVTDEGAVRVAANGLDDVVEALRSELMEAAEVDHADDLLPLETHCLSRPARDVSHFVSDLPDPGLGRLGVARIPSVEHLGHGPD